MMATRREEHSALGGTFADKDYARAFGAEYARTVFGLMLAQARMYRGMTQAALAAECGVSQSYIAKLESGEANLTVARIGEILVVLKLKPVLGFAEFDGGANQAGASPVASHPSS